AVGRRPGVRQQGVGRAQGIVLAIERLVAGILADQGAIAFAAEGVLLGGRARAIGLLEHVLKVVEELPRLAGGLLLHPAAIAVVAHGHRATYRLGSLEAVVLVPAVIGNASKGILLRAVAAVVIAVGGRSRGAALLA